MDYSWLTTSWSSILMVVLTTIGIYVTLITFTRLAGLCSEKRPALIGCYCSYGKGRQKCDGRRNSYDQESPYQTDITDHPPKAKVHDNAKDSKYRRREMFALLCAKNGFKVFNRRF